MLETITVIKKKEKQKTNTKVKDEEKKVVENGKSSSYTFDSHFQSFQQYNNLLSKGQTCVLRNIV